MIAGKEIRGLFRKKAIKNGLLPPREGRAS
jgi:hypothetical protein